MSLVEKYIDNIIKEYDTWRAREHSYRPALKELLESMKDSILATNEPAREKCWAPDFIITDKKNIPRWYIEAKDIVSNILDEKKNQAQIAKYFDWELGYNFIHTDNIEFRFYRNAQLVESVKIAEIQDNHIIPKPEKFEKLEMLLKNFLTFKAQTITSSKKLSEVMAWKARMIKRVIYMTLENNKDGQTEIHNQFEVFKKILVHDLNNESFADIYAQTITYWLFTARLHDPTLPTFDRDEAARLLPKSNPFLKRFFQSLRDDLDSRIEWIVDDLIELFLASDVKKLLEWYWKTTSRNDPIIHFYEDFLSEYDSKLRKAKWVYYTPEPVVNFMIRGVDYILKNEFGLSDWIADISKTTIEVDTDNIKYWKIQKEKKEVHKVQILDPATGTGTFLNDIIKYIYETRFAWISWIWKNYVDENLIPRLHWFEIMMASYAMAHLKLDLTLVETWYNNESQKRLWIYLTNSLEESHNDTWTIFANWLSDESKQANYIKKDMPIMTIIWNPPYAVSSQNKGDYIMNLLKWYKKDLNERKINLDDDYIKFIRYAEHYIERNWEWILCYISNNSYLDWITHRQMRKHLLETFDKIYIYDLHWNARKKEVSPDGSVDQNVFDIMAWVNIIFWVKNAKKEKWQLAKVFHFDSYWKRQEKYNHLSNNSIDSVEWKELELKEPYYFFVPKDFATEEKYNKGFSVSEIFDVNSNWIETHKDWIMIQFDENKMIEIKNNFEYLTSEDIKQKYNIKKEWSEWKIKYAKKDINNSKVKKILYRPFDIRSTIYSINSKWVLARPRNNVMQHFLKNNLWLFVKRQAKQEFSYAFCWKYISESCIFESAYAKTQVFPLYLYPTQKVTLPWQEVAEKKANFNDEVISKIEKKLEMKLKILEHQRSDEVEDNFSPEDLFDYIYAVLHSKTYRETYKEFLKIDFPKIPFDCDKNTFFKMRDLWEELRSYHLMENENLIPKNFITTYPIDWDNKVWKIKYEDEKVFINDTQYFQWVPSNVWEFYIWGYMPAQKWLKDRKERALTYEDILHYSKIILSLKETIRIMGEIESVFKI